MRINRGAAIVVLLSLLSGCTQFHYELGEALPLEVEAHREGDSLVSVMATLGPPLRLAAADDHLLMAWEAWRIRESAIGVSLGFAGADFLNADWGRARVRGDYLLMTFDAQKRLTAAARIKRDNRVGGGTAVQPLIGFVSVVDVQDLLLPLPQNSWGANQLLPLPAVLNNPQSPGLGNTGIEQRGTPVGAGARSLEWRD
jgi:hypothetical protein